MPVNLSPSNYHSGDTNRKLQYLHSVAPIAQAVLFPANFAISFINRCKEGRAKHFKIIFAQLAESQTDKNHLDAEIFFGTRSTHRLPPSSRHVCSEWRRPPYSFWDSRTLACRASQVFLASPSNIAVLGL